MFQKLWRQRAKRDAHSDFSKEPAESYGDDAQGDEPFWALQFTSFNQCTFLGKSTDTNWENKIHSALNVQGVRHRAST